MLTKACCSFADNNHGWAKVSQLQAMQCGQYRAADEAQVLHPIALNIRFTDWTRFGRHLQPLPNPALHPWLLSEHLPMTRSGVTRLRQPAGPLVL